MHINYVKDIQKLPVYEYLQGSSFDQGSCDQSPPESGSTRLSLTMLVLLLGSLCLLRTKLLAPTKHIIFQNYLNVK